MVEEAELVERGVGRTRAEITFEDDDAPYICVHPICGKETSRTLPSVERFVDKPPIWFWSQLIHLKVFPMAMKNELKNLIKEKEVIVAI